MEEPKYSARNGPVPRAAKMGAPNETIDIEFKPNEIALGELKAEVKNTHNRPIRTDFIEIMNCSHMLCLPEGKVP